MYWIEHLYWTTFYQNSARGNVPTSLCPLCCFQVWFSRNGDFSPTIWCCNSSSNLHNTTNHCQHDDIYKTLITLFWIENMSIEIIFEPEKIMIGVKNCWWAMTYCSMSITWFCDLCNQRGWCLSWETCSRSWNITWYLKITWKIHIPSMIYVPASFRCCTLRKKPASNFCLLVAKLSNNGELNELSATFPSFFSSLWN